MNPRHLHCFVVLAEELHFGRAAARLHIEQSPLSRIIRKLEDELEARLLERTPRGIHLTWAGEVFLDNAVRILLDIEEAKANVKAAATGCRGRLRIALSDTIAQTRLTALLARCREEEPDVDIHLFETSLVQMAKGLRNGLYDAGLSMSDDSPGCLIEPAWCDPLVVAVTHRHPLLANRRVTLAQTLNYPWITYHPRTCEGFHRQLEQWLQAANAKPTVAERVSTHDLMVALVAAGYGVGICSAAHLVPVQSGEVVARPLTDRTAILTTYVLRLNAAPSAQLDNFLNRVRCTGATTGKSPLSMS